MTFKRVKLKATVETEAMLLSENQIDTMLDEVRDKLKQLRLDVVSIEPTTLPQVKAPEPPKDEDPWTYRGLPAS